MRSVIDFMSDPDMLGRWFEGDSWDRWRAVLKAAYGLEMSQGDRDLFAEVAGAREPPQSPVSEIVCLVGRGGGKDAVASALAAYVAATGDFSRLRPGEKASILCIANDRDQASIAFGYVKGLFEQVPALAELVVRVTADTIELTNGAEIVVATNSYRAVRGRTIVLVIFDECCFFRGEDTAQPDVEVDAAVDPGLARWPGSLKIMISSTYRRAGIAYQRWHDCFGKDDDETLVVLGTTLQFNPTFDAKVIDRHLERDYERFSAEYLSQWRDDLADYIDREALEACVEAGCYERAPQPGISYTAFVDVSGGRADSFVLAIGHDDGRGRGVLDCVREWRPPFDPNIVTGEAAELLRTYGVSSVTGDRYAGEWPVERFQSYGIAYLNSERPKSDLYRDFLPLANAGRVSLLDHKRSINQFCALERRISRTGRDTISHPPGSHDDCANAVAGVLTLVAQDVSPALWRATVFGQPAEPSPWTSAVYSVTAIGDDGAIATLYFAKSPDRFWLAQERALAPPLLVLDIDCGTMAEVGGWPNRVVARMQAIIADLPGNGQFAINVFGPAAFEFSAPPDALATAKLPELAAVAAPYLARGWVRLSRLAADRVRAHPASALLSWRHGNDGNAVAAAFIQAVLLGFFEEKDYSMLEDREAA